MRNFEAARQVHFPYHSLPRLFHTVMNSPAPASQGASPGAIQGISQSVDQRSNIPSAPASLDKTGLVACCTAFAIWGVLPLYLKALHAVPVLQVTAQRLVWGCVLAIAWLAISGKLGLVRTALANPSTRWRLCASALLISLNWITYVWGVANNHVVETSLGYFINPLLNVVLGVLVLSERLNRAQWIAVSLAAAGVGYLTWSAGHLPWISLALAATFGLYGLVRKMVAVDAFAGFAAETLLVFPVGLGYLIWSELHGTGAMGHIGTGIDLLLLLGGPLTAAPLVLFAVGARRLPYSTVGLLQYIGPTLQLMLGVLVYREPFSGPRVTGFIIIWAALVIYAADGLWRSRKLAAVRSSQVPPPSLGK
jgi:chloramphenicol-sensitive protein RarD